MWKVIIVVAAGCLFGCAQKPETIVPSYVPDSYYSALTCDQLEVERLKVTETLAAANAHQQKAWSNDVVGVAMLGIPVSGAGNIAPHISNYKGMLEANARVQRLKNCPTPAATTAALPSDRVAAAP